MRHALLKLIGIFLLAPSLQALPVTDNAGLTMSVGTTGVVSGVGLNGTPTPSGTGGGFFLREPNSSTRVPMTGSAVSTNGVLKLELASTALNASVTADVTEGNGYIEVSGTLENLDPVNNPDRGLWLGFNVPVNTIGWKWGQTLSTSPVITSQDAGYESIWDKILVPIPAVWSANGGIALSIPPTHPCVFEVAADAAGLRIQMAFGLSPDTVKFPSKAHFRFRIYSIDGTWGFRDALAKHYDWYPDYYKIKPEVMTAIDHHHDWIRTNFPDDFTAEGQVDPAALEYMAYTKTSARIQGIPNVLSINTTQGYKDAIATTDSIQHYKKNGAQNDPLLIEGRQALNNSICYEPDGSFGVFSQTTESTDGSGDIDFPHNCDPDLFKGAAQAHPPVFADMYLRKAADLRGINSNFDSIHWDRLGGWSLFLNYRREHFAYIDHPLTFDNDGNVCIYTKHTNYELFDAYRELNKTGGLFHEAAGMKEYGSSKFTQGKTPAGQERNGMFFLAALVAGGWQEGSFNEQPLGGFDFERMSVGRKAYRVSSGNIIAASIPPTLDLVRRALAQTTAYGFACPVQVQYFYPTNHPGYLPDYSWYHLPDHKALWDKYEPANLAIRLAGWEPVTHAYSSSSEVQLQRFGGGQEFYLTAWGPNPPASVEIEVDAAALGMSAIATFSEMISDTPMTVVPSAEGWKLTVPMETNMTRVIKITSSAALTATFDESSTWTCPTGVTSVTAECWGGGGAGGASVRNGSGSNSTGGGGAGGAYAKKVISGLVPGTNYAVTVGAGGVSVAGADDGTSTPGGESWFATAATVLAKGGAGGIARNGVGLVGAGGVGSTEGSIGDVLNAGGSGSSGNGAASGGGGGGSGGTGLAGITATGSTGAAAVTDGGPRGNGATTNADGSTPASGPGGGGGGARGPNAAKAGGTGSPGRVILTYTASNPAPPTYSEWSGQYNLVQGPEGDDDGDGHSNQFEFIAGLVPTDAASVFKTTAAPVPGQLNQVSIEISPIFSGRTYTVKSSDSLTSGSWIPLVDPIVSDEGDVRTVVDTAATGERKFYVIEISMP